MCIRDRKIPFSLFFLLFDRKWRFPKNEKNLFVRYLSNKLFKFNEGHIEIQVKLSSFKSSELCIKYQLKEGGGYFFLGHPVCFYIAQNFNFEISNGAINRLAPINSNVFQKFERWFKFRITLNKTNQKSRMKNTFHFINRSTRCMAR